MPRKLLEHSTFIGETSMPKPGGRIFNPGGGVAARWMAPAGFSSQCSSPLEYSELDIAVGLLRPRTLPVSVGVAMRPMESKDWNVALAAKRCGDEYICSAPVGRPQS